MRSGRFAGAVWRARRVRQVVNVETGFQGWEGAAG